MAASITPIPGPLLAKLRGAGFDDLADALDAPPRPPRIVFTGPPRAGVSSMLDALLGTGNIARPPDGPEPRPQRFIHCDEATAELVDGEIVVGAPRQLLQHCDLIDLPSAHTLIAGDAVVAVADARHSATAAADADGLVFTHGDLVAPRPDTMIVSTPLRIRAVATGDARLDELSGFPALARWVAQELLPLARNRRNEAAAAHRGDVVAAAVGALRAAIDESAASVDELQAERKQADKAHASLRQTLRDAEAQLAEESAAIRDRHGRRLVEALRRIVTDIAESDGEDALVEHLERAGDVAQQQIEAACDEQLLANQRCLALLDDPRSILLPAPPDELEPQVVQRADRGEVSKVDLALTTARNAYFPALLMSTGAAALGLATLATGGLAAIAALGFGGRAFVADRRKQRAHRLERAIRDAAQAVERFIPDAHHALTDGLTQLQRNARDQLRDGGRALTEAAEHHVERLDAALRSTGQARAERTVELRVMLHELELLSPQGAS